MISDWKYQTDKVALVPYNEASGAFPDGLLGHLYLRTKEDGLLDTVWAGVPNVHFDKFVSQLASDKVALQIYYLQGDPMIPMGYCFLYQVDGDPGARLGQFGFCFFKEYWGRKEIRDGVWLCLDYWIEVIGVDVLYGATLADNYLARNFSRNFGFREIAILPKFLRQKEGRTDARLVFLERERFLPLLESWRKSNLLV